MSFDKVMDGAIRGIAIGSAAGLVPLGIGYLCRERRKAVTGFVGCALAGAVGGLAPSIAIMVAATAQIVQPQRTAGARTSEWSALATFADKLWYLAALAWLFVWMIGSMFVSAAFLTPLVLGVSNCAPRDSVGKIIEPGVVFGGLGVGILIGFAGVSFVSRRFMSSATHRNWAERFRASTVHRSPLLRRLAFYYYKFLLPSHDPLLEKQ